MDQKGEIPMSAKSGNTKKGSNRIRVFIPNARLLTSAETKSLPVKDAEKAATNGLWVEVDCPDDSCTIDGGRACIPATLAARQKDKGIWLKIFCPEDRCYFDSASGLP